MRHAIRMYLTWQRLEIVLVALLVPGLIVESSVANGWVYGGGSLSVVAFLRGFFFEVLTYVTARQAYIRGASSIGLARCSWLWCRWLQST